MEVSPVGINRALRLMIAVLLIPSGAVLVLIAGTGRVGGLINGLGLSLIVAGIVAAFRELVIVPFETSDTANQVASRLHDKLFKDVVPGIRKIDDFRRGYDGYYRWVINTGRSRGWHARKVRPRNGC
jgi:hypothetical protein